MVHATCVAVAGRGVLLLGPPGCGKSDLALRLIDSGAALVADDQVVLARRGDDVVASAPDELRGRMEVRGVGLVTVEPVAQRRVALVLDLVPADQVPRLPEIGVRAYLGVSLPCIAIAPFEASAAAKVRLAVGALSGNSATPS